MGGAGQRAWPLRLCLVYANVTVSQDCLHVCASVCMCAYVYVCVCVVNKGHSCGHRADSDLPSSAHRPRPAPASLLHLAPHSSPSLRSKLLERQTAILFHSLLPHSSCLCPHHTSETASSHRPDLLNANYQASLSILTLLHSAAVDILLLDATPSCLQRLPLLGLIQGPACPSPALKRGHSPGLYIQSSPIPPHAPK